MECGRLARRPEKIPPGETPAPVTRTLPPIMLKVSAKPVKFLGSKMKYEDYIRSRKPIRLSLGLLFLGLLLPLSIVIFEGAHNVSKPSV